jgi:hypothetical protein
MQGLTSSLLGQACRIFLTIAYPEELNQLPPPRSHFLDLQGGEELETLLTPPLCKTLQTPEGEPRGYSLRLGCSHYPHLKLEIVQHSCGEILLSVNTHDALPCAANHPDATAWAELQAGNRALKEAIERAWEDAGLVTFNKLLRDGLEKQTRP